MRRLWLCPLPLLVAVACGSEERLPVLLGPKTTASIAFVGPAGVTVLDAEAGEVRDHVERGVPSGDGRWVFGTSLTDDGTAVEAVAADGSRRWRTEVADDLEVRTVAPDGALVALLPADLGGDVYAPAGRTSTPLTVVSTQGQPTRQLVLDGNYEPEAFTADGTGLFVIEYLPPERPDRYRVRRLDLATGDIEGVHSLDKHLQEAMRGTARVQALADAGDRLYTLYTVDGPEGVVAFVHVLDLVEGWAHCVDLPAGVGGSEEPALAVAAVAGRDSVVVVDADRGLYSEIDEETLVASPARDLGAPVDRDGGAVRAAAVGERVYVGAGSAITVIDPDAGAVARWTAPDRVLDVRADPSGDRLWAATPGVLHAFDLDDGTIVQEAPAPDIRGADVGDVAPPVDDGRAGLQCAC
jgi:hypothetical protein